MRGDSDFSPDVCVGQGVGVGKLEGGLSFYWGSRAVLRAGCGPRGRRGLRACCGSSRPLPTPGGGCGRENSNTRTQTNKQQQQKSPGTGGDGKALGGGAAGRALRAERSRSRGESPQGGDTAGSPGVSPGPAPGKVAQAGGRVPVAAVRSGHERAAFWRSAVSCH